MSNPGFREPTNEELWSQPPPPPPQVQPNQALAPVQQPQPRPPQPQPQQVPYPVPAARPDRSAFVLAIASMALAIPLSAIASSTAGTRGLLIVWFGIIAINFAHAWSRRNGRRQG